jgi:CspA family cold shock protein
MSERQDGRVKWFDPAKGYGFISPTDGGKDVFLHASKLPDHVDNPSAGQSVRFDLEKGDKGLRAVNVQFI